MRYLKITGLFFFVFLLSDLNVNAQFVVSPGVSYQKQMFEELCFKKGVIAEDAPSNTFIGGGVESNCSKNNLIIAPKANYEVTFAFVTLRLGITDYINSGKNDVRFIPEIGFGFNGYIDLTWGYNAPLTKNRLPEISRSRISLIINFSPEMWRESGFLLHDKSSKN